MMILQRQSWFYNNTLKSKQKTIHAAVALATKLNDRVKDLSEPDQKLCQTALNNFYAGIFEANQPTKNSRDIIKAEEKLLPLDSIIPDAEAILRKKFDDCLYWQDNSEFLYVRLTMGIIIISEIVVLAVIAAGILAAASLGFAPLWGAMMLSITPIVASLSLSLCALDDRWKSGEEYRQCVGGRSAISMSHDIPTQSTIQATAPEQPVVATAVYEKANMN